MIATSLDGRCSGFAMGTEEPRIAPVSCRWKWRPWKSPIMGWAVMQPKKIPVGREMEWVWRHVAIFTDRDAAADFLEQMQ